MNTRKWIAIVGALSLLLTGVQQVMAIEEAAYTVVQKDGEFEVREYAPHVLAEVRVDGDFEAAGSKAFRQLFRYISGDNVARTRVAMTAPVAQKSAGEKIAMTAPVGQQRVQEQWVVSFMMPGDYTLATLPQPLDAGITLRQVPAQKMAVVRYSGTWREKNYLEHKAALDSWMRRTGLASKGSPVWARYNPPFTPWFLRRNEILVPVD